MPFRKGVSGNPGGAVPGRKQALAAELFKNDLPKALKVLREGLDDPDERYRIAENIIDRIYGKPSQAVDLAHSGNVTVVFKDK
jgi:hypothetical protein